MTENLPTNHDADPPVPVDAPTTLESLRAAIVHGVELIDAVAVWQQRDPAVAQPAVTAAGHHAVAAVDGMLAGLGRLRSQLVSEIREHQDASAARTDALLERLQRESGAVVELPDNGVYDSNSDGFWPDEGDDD